MARATVKKSAVIAYFEGSEQEVIAIPKEEGDLKDTDTVEYYSKIKESTNSRQINWNKGFKFELKGAKHSNCKK